MEEIVLVCAKWTMLTFAIGLCLAMWVGMIWAGWFFGRMLIGATIGTIKEAGEKRKEKFERQRIEKLKAFE